MTPTPKTDLELLAEWIAYREECVSGNGASLRQICIALAERYECSPLTVRRYLDPFFADKKRAADRKADSRRYAPIKRRTAKRRYEKQYRQATRHPERYLPWAFAAASAADLESVTREFANQTGFAFRPSTIKRVLKDYELGQREGSIRGPPFLHEDRERPGYWHYSSLSPPESTEG